MTDTALIDGVVRRLWQLLTLSLLAGFVQAQTTAEKPSLENAPAPGGPVVISTYPFVQGGNIDTAWVDAEMVLFGVGGKTAEAIGAQPGQFAVAALNVKTHSLRMVVIGKIIRYKDDLLITSISDAPKSQVQCGTPDKPLRNAPNVSDPLCSKWRLGIVQGHDLIGMRDEHGYIDSGDRNERLPYSKPMLIKPSGPPIQIDIAFEFLGENLHYAPWLKAYLLVWRNRTVHSGRQFPFMSEEECRERMLNPQGHERNNNWLVQASPFKTPEDRKRRDRILASSCRQPTPSNTFRLLNPDGSLTELPVPAGYNSMFGLADSGSLTRRGLLMSPSRELPPEKEHLDGLWLATDDGNFTQIYKGGGIGVPSAYDEASTSADGCRGVLDQARQKPASRLQGIRRLQWRRFTFIH